MFRLLRIGLLCILLLALPLQGMAATAVSACTSGHHAAATVRSTSAHEVAVASSSHRLHHAVDTRFNVRLLAGSGDATAQGDGVQTQLPSTGHSCSACADCCTGSALPNSPLTVATPETAVELRSESRPRPARASEEAPERPPRAWRA